MVCGTKDIGPVRFQDVNDKAVELHHQTLTSYILFWNQPGRLGDALYSMRAGQGSLRTDLDQGGLSNIESGLKVSCAGCVEVCRKPRLPAAGESS